MEALKDSEAGPQGKALQQLVKQIWNTDPNGPNAEALKMVKALSDKPDPWTQATDDFQQVVDSFPSRNKGSSLMQQAGTPDQEVFWASVQQADENRKKQKI